MPTLIKNKQIHALDTIERISLKTFSEAHEALLNEGHIALLIESDQSVDHLPAHFEKAAYIAVDFPIFTDGRGYSVARDLRLVKHYHGEIRAVGDVLPDQLHSMLRCGFDAFELADGKDAQKALTAFDVFSQKYQADVLEPKPVYLR